MEVFKGIPVSQGIAFGKVYFFEKKERAIPTYIVANLETEKERFFSAQKKAIEQLNTLHDTMGKEISAEINDIFTIHIMMLEDEDFIQAIIQRIEKEHKNIFLAIQESSADLIRELEAINDDYISNRANDVRDIVQRLFAILLQDDVLPIIFPKNAIVFAHDLTPSDMGIIAKKTINAIVTTEGSINSHVAILARSLGIPAVLGTNTLFSNQYNNRDCIVDGKTGIAYISPDNKTLAIMQKNQQNFVKQQKMLQSFIGKESKSLSGIKINLFANVGSLDDIDNALKNGAEGIGLFRTEFLYLERENFPTEDELFMVYKEALKKLNEKPLVIRTFDVGSDKQAPYLAKYLKMETEINPALGMRGIRISLTHPKIFKTQLRALLRASPFGNLSIMFPMIISVDEVKKIKIMINDVQAELKQSKIAFDQNIKIGIMIETPAAALMSEELAPLVDFFSIGTNDLTQYCLAIDRENKNLVHYYSVQDPAILKLIQMTVLNARKHNISVGICGELASNLKLTQTFLDMKLNYLSVNSSDILPLRKKIRESK